MREWHIDQADCLSDEQADALAGRMLVDDDYNLLVEEDAVVYKPDGSVLLRFCKGAVDAVECVSAFPALEKAAGVTNNRGMAAGHIRNHTEVEDFREKIVKGVRYQPIKRDGTLSNTNYGKKVRSSVIGAYDRSPRFPYCRLTAFNLGQPDLFAQAMPFIRSVDAAFKQHAPERHAAQMEYVQRTSDDFLIHGTAFTTITVNMNFRTAVHKDVGDLPEGFGVMSVIRAGHYDGCFLCFPKYKVAVDMRTTDVLLADVHEWHGNTPLKGTPGKYKRLATVHYYRRKMDQCGSADEELARAKGGR